MSSTTNRTTLLPMLLFLLTMAGTTFAGDLLWPLQVGYRYEYNRSDNTGTQWPMYMEVTSQVTYNSLDYFKLKEWNYDNDGAIEEIGPVRSTETALYGYNPNGNDYEDFRKAPVGTTWSYFKPDASGMNYNTYLMRPMSLGRGKVYVLTGRLPITPKTREGEPLASTGEARYWSLCHNGNGEDSMYPGLQYGCLMDDEVVTNAGREFVIAYSRGSESPSNARSECGVTWRDFGLESRQWFHIRWTSVMPDDHLPEFSPDVLGGLFFRCAADLTDQDHRFRLRILVEQFHRIHEIRANDRIPADPDARGLAQPKPGDLVHGFVGECPAS